MYELPISQFIVPLSSELDKITNNFVFEGYQALASLLKAPLGSMLVLYIVLTGYGVARGVIKQPSQALLTFCIKAGLIYMAAMNWNWFASHVRDLFVVGSESIASTLMRIAHTSTVGESVNQGLQAVLNEILTLGLTLFDLGSLRNITPYFAGGMVFLSGSITVGLAFIEIVIAKLMLSVTLCTAPLFILFTLFEQTKALYERWLGTLTGFAFVLIFVSSVVKLCIHLLHWVTHALSGNTEQLSAAVWVPIFMVACLCVLAIREAVAMGKSIGGSLCTSSGAAMVGGLIRGSLGMLKYFPQLRKKSPALFHQSGSNKLNKSSSMQAASKQFYKNLRRGIS